MNIKSSYKLITLLILSTVITACATYNEPENIANPAYVSGVDVHQTDLKGETYLGSIDGNIANSLSSPIRVAPGRHNFVVMSYLSGEAPLDLTGNEATRITATVLPGHHYRFIPKVTFNTFSHDTVIYMTDQNGHTIAQGSPSLW